VIFEAPHRVQEALADMADVLGNRASVVARELTKLHETIARGTLSALADDFAGSALKGEIVIVVGPAEPQVVSDDAISTRLDEVLGAMSLKDAAKTIAGELGVPKSRVYALGIKPGSSPTSGGGAIAAGSMRRCSSRPSIWRSGIAFSGAVSRRRSERSISLPSRVGAWRSSK
jgi:hypothetical protein